MDIRTMMLDSLRKLELTSTKATLRVTLVALRETSRVAQSLYQEKRTARFGKRTGPRLVIIESPYAGDVARNVAYLRMAMLDSLRRGEAPFASHFLYPEVLEDTISSERELGIKSGLAWGAAAEATVAYVDLGLSPGMRLGLEEAARHGRPIERRELGRAALEEANRLARGVNFYGSIRALELAARTASDQTRFLQGQRDELSRELAKRHGELEEANRQRAEEGARWAARIAELEATWHGAAEARHGPAEARHHLGAAPGEGVSDAARRVAGELSHYKRRVEELERTIAGERGITVEAFREEQPRG